MTSFTSTRVFLTDEPDEDMVQTKLEVLELTPTDWADVADALEYSANHNTSYMFAFAKRMRGLAKDIRSEILTHLPEEVA